MSIYGAVVHKLQTTINMINQGNLKTFVGLRNTYENLLTIQVIFLKIRNINVPINPAYGMRIIFTLLSNKNAMDTLNEC